jgi:hypothetical protein
MHKSIEWGNSWDMVWLALEAGMKHNIYYGTLQIGPVSKSSIWRHSLNVVALYSVLGVSGLSEGEHAL